MRLKITVFTFIFFLLIPSLGFAQKSKGQTSKKTETISTNKQSAKKKTTPKPEEQPSQTKEQADQPIADSTQKQENTTQPTQSTQPTEPVSLNTEANTTPAPKKKVFGNSDIEAYGLAPEVKAASQPQNNNANNDSQSNPKTFDPNGYTRRDGTYVTPRIGGRGRIPVKK